MNVFHEFVISRNGRKPLCSRPTLRALGGVRATLIKRLEKIVQVEEHARQLHEDMEHMSRIDSSVGAIAEHA
jgi:hypothetical protein